jgi:hypothetical protein
MNCLANNFDALPKFAIAATSRFEVSTSLLYVTATASFGGAGIIAPGGRQSLAPGQETEVTACGGNGNGGAPGNRARIVVFVSAVAMDGCSYMPSKRYPRRWLGAS